MSADAQRLIQELMSSADPEGTMWGHLTDLLAERRLLTAAGKGRPRQPGQPLKLLLAGYAGAGNIGSDIRVHETIRQLLAFFPPQSLDIGLVIVNPALAADPFLGVRKLELTYGPAFFFEQCAEHDGVVACEGSLFKSNFSDIMAMLMVGSLGLALAEDKLAVGYGAEAGEMSARLLDFTKRECRGAWIACRNEPSRTALTALGLRAAAGADPAWTFEPASPERGGEILRGAGWDGRLPVLGICPINPFWWPVRIDLEKARALSERGEYRELHYGSVFFHHHSEETERRYRTYLNALAGAVTAWQRERHVFPVIVGMELVDRYACEHLAERLALEGRRPPVLVSDGRNAHEIVSVLRSCSSLVSSRFHAIVASMPAQVPSAGLAMDERVANLLDSRGHRHLLVSVEDEGLEEKLVSLLRLLDADRERIADGIGCAVAEQVRRMGLMGMGLVEEVRRVYPAVSPRADLAPTWEAHLPSLPASLLRLLERHPPSAADRIEH